MLDTNLQILLILEIILDTYIIISNLFTIIINYFLFLKLVYI